MFRLDGAWWIDSSTSRSCLRSRSRPGARRVSPAPEAVPVERLVGIGLVKPVMVRPVAGVWESVDSRPVPPTRFFFAAAFFGLFFGAAFLAFGAGFFAALRGAAFLGRLALARRAVRRFGADALFAFALTVFFFWAFALRAGFLAILIPRSLVSGPT